MFNDAEHPRCQRIDIRQGQRRGVQGALDQAPRDTERGGCLRCGSPGSDHGGHEGVAEPTGGPCPAWDLGGLLGECPPRAQVLIAEESQLGPDQFDWASDRNVTQALRPA